MFKGPVPPIVPFSLGSLGFMTPFRILNWKYYNFFTFESCTVLDEIRAWIYAPIIVCQIRAIRGGNMGGSDRILTYRFKPVGSGQFTL